MRINVKHKIKHAIVVLGHRNNASGELSQIAVDRCLAAYQLWCKEQDAWVICTGGFGPSFNNTKVSHADWLKLTLIQLGIPVSQFLLPALSGFTLEDATCANAVLSEHVVTKLTLVTSDFHMPRASFIFSRVFPNTEIVCSAAVSNLTTEQRTQLEAHEVAALARDTTCFI